MRLAKYALDVGLFTNDHAAMREFYEAAGLSYEELLKTGGGVHQHRYSMHGSVLKVNDAREPLPESPSNLRRLEIRSERRMELRDPDGTVVVLTDDVRGIGVEWASSDPERVREMLVVGFGAAVADAERLRIGSTIVTVTGGGSAVGPMRARGFRYLTVQVHDTVAEHQRLLDVGWLESTAPTKLGETALISIVRDFDGTSVEISQRASLTGPLPA